MASQQLIIEPNKELQKAIKEGLKLDTKDLKKLLPTIQKQLPKKQLPKKPKDDGEIKELKRMTSGSPEFQEYNLKLQKRVLELQRIEEEQGRDGKEVKKTSNKMLAGVAALGGIFGAGLNQLLNTLKESSGYLGTVLGLMSKAVNVSLLPLGIMLGTIIKPAMIGLWKYTTLMLKDLPTAHAIGDAVGKGIEQDIQTVTDTGQDTRSGDDIRTDASKLLEEQLAEIENTGLMQPILEWVARFKHGLSHDIAVLEDITDFFGKWDLWTKIASLNISGIIDGIAKWFDSLKWFQDAWADTGDSIESLRQSWGAVFERIYGFFSDIYDTYMAPADQAIISAFQSMYNIFSDIQLPEISFDNITQWWNSIEWPNWSPELNDIIQWWDNITWPDWAPTWDILVQWWDNIKWPNWQPTLGYLASWWDNIEWPNWQPVWDDLVQWWDNITWPDWLPTVQSIIQWWDNIEWPSWVPSISGIQSWWGGVINSIKSALKSVSDVIKDAIPDDPNVPLRGHSDKDYYGDDNNKPNLHELQPTPYTPFVPSSQGSYFGELNSLLKEGAISLEAYTTAIEYVRENTDLLSTSFGDVYKAAGQLEPELIEIAEVAQEIVPSLTDLKRAASEAAQAHVDDLRAYQNKESQHSINKAAQIADSEAYMRNKPGFYDATNYIGELDVSGIKPIGEIDISELIIDDKSYANKLLEKHGDRVKIPDYWYDDKETWGDSPLTERALSNLENSLDTLTDAYLKGLEIWKKVGAIEGHPNSLTENQSNALIKTINMIGERIGVLRATLEYVSNEDNERMDSLYSQLRNEFGSLSHVASEDWLSQINKLEGFFSRIIGATSGLDNVDTSELDAIIAQFNDTISGDLTSGIDDITTASDVMAETADIQEQSADVMTQAADIQEQSANIQQQNADSFKTEISNFGNSIDSLNREIRNIPNKIQVTANVRTSYSVPSGYIDSAFRKILQDG